MDASNWINLGLFLVTALGVVAAAKSARGALKSESEARQYARAAIAAQERQAEAQERSAAALEASAGTRLSAPDEPRWRLVQETDERWRLFNSGPGPALDVRLSVEEDPSAFVEGTELPKPVLAENLAMTFFAARSLASPADLTLVIKWREPGAGDEHEARASL